MDTVNILGTQFTLSAVVVWLIEKLKASKAMPFINTETAKLNRLLSIVLAFLSALGIQYSYAFNHQTGTLILTINGLLLANILHFAWTWLQNFVMQQAIFKTRIMHLTQGKV